MRHKEIFGTVQGAALPGMGVGMLISTAIIQSKSLGNKPVTVSYYDPHQQDERVTIQVTHVQG